MRRGTLDLRDAERGAASLLGAHLVRIDGSGVRRGRIVETEAYLPDDPASHSFRGPSPRNAAMFGPAGRAYVYRIHRVHCLNVVTGPEGRGEAVLIRSVEPVDGLREMERSRLERRTGRTEPRGFDLTNGPGKLCQAFDVTPEWNGVDLLTPADPPASAVLLLEPRTSRRRFEIERTPRIGISKAREAALRFTIAGNPWVSRAPRIAAD